MSDPLDQLCVNTVHVLSVDAVQQASNGHPGMPRGAAASEMLTKAKQA